MFVDTRVLKATRKLIDWPMKVQWKQIKHYECVRKRYSWKFNLIEGFPMCIFPHNTRTQAKDFVMLVLNKSQSMLWTFCRLLKFTTTAAVYTVNLCKMKDLCRRLYIWLCLIHLPLNSALRLIRTISLDTLHWHPMLKGTLNLSPWLIRTKIVFWLGRIKRSPL